MTPSHAYIPAFGHRWLTPFRDRLTADQAAAIIDFIKSRWDRNEREYQWWMTVTHQDEH